MQPSEYLADIKFSMAYIVPEITLFLVFVLVILAGIIFNKQSKFLVPLIFLAGIGVACYFSLVQYLSPDLNMGLFSNALLLTNRSVYLKLLFALCGLLTLIFRQLSDQKEKPTEFYALVLAIILGSNLMVLSANLLVAFMSLEIISLASYVLVALENTKRNAEASVKYLLYGLFASAIMLYGISLVFGFTGSVNFTEINFYNALANVEPIAVSVALFMIMAGIMFKISAFPFHFWAPDVYEVTPMATLAFFSTCSKIAGFGLLLNFIPAVWQFDFKSYVAWFSPEYLIGFCAVITILLGNLMALAQKNIKRMLAYSAIAHSGFMLLPLTSFENQASESVLYYLATYIFLSFSSFFIIDKLIKITENEEFHSYKGLGLQFPFLGICAIVSMIGLTGLPPTTGFIAKFYIFSAVWDSYTLEQEQQFAQLFVFGLINTVVGLFYYLKLPYFMFLKKADTLTTKNLSIYEYIFAFLLAFSLLLFFIKPEWIKF